MADVAPVWGSTTSVMGRLHRTQEKAPYHVGEHGPLICLVRDPDGYRIKLIELDSR